MKPQRIWLLAGLFFFVIATGIVVYYFQNQYATVSNKKNSSILSKIMLDNGDYVKPKFSPNGKLLAYSQVLLEKDRNGQDTEYTGVLIMDLETGKVKELLTPEQSKQYAVYKAFILDISWKNNRECVIEISDGDVGAGVLTIDVITQKVTGTGYIEEDERMPELTVAEKVTRDQITASFPEWDQDYLDDSIMQYSFLIPGRGIVLQKNYAGQDKDIWLLDFQSKQSKRILEVFDNGCLRNGFTFKDSMVFLVSNDNEATIYQAKNDEPVIFDALKAKMQYGYLEIKYQSAKKVIFRIIANHTYEKGDNPLYLYDGEQISKMSDYAELYDADVDPKGEKIAFCYWENNRRHIAVKSLVKVKLDENSSKYQE